MTNQEEDKMYISNIDLSNQEDWQFLYGSQLYGTSFGIYGKFTTQKTTSDGEDAYRILNIELEILNYKGPVSLGFLPKDQYQNAIEAIKLKLSEGGNTSYTPEWKALLALKGAKKAFFKEGFKPEDEKLFKRGNIIELNRMLFPLRKLDHDLNSKNDKTEDHNEAQEHHIFDSEFFEKEGNYWERKPENRDGYYSENLISEWPSDRCHKGVLKVTF